jgi:hypothetical protein
MAKGSSPGTDTRRNVGDAGIFARLLNGDKNVKVTRPAVSSRHSAFRRSTSVRAGENPD